MTERIVTPVGELAWVFITGQGRKDLNDNDRFVASIKYAKGSPELATVEAQLEAFWEENKPKNAKMKSNGLKEEVDKDGNPTGFYLLNFWTGITFKDGKPKVVKTYNSKGVEVSLGGRKIGNGSRGAISGVMAIYDQGVAARGVTLYLNSIQITKFVEFTDDAGFEAIEDEDGFTGEDLNDEGFEPQAEGDAPAKVTL